MLHPRQESDRCGPIEEKIADLRQMSDALSKYVSACRNPAALQQCPLLEDLGDVNDAADD
jgi:hypothetical protein